MELVNLTYRYINRFINSDDLLKELNKISNTKKYSAIVKTTSTDLYNKIKKIKETIPNEMDDVLKKRLANITRILNMLEELNPTDEKTKEFTEKKIKNLKKEQKLVKDGGKLYEKTISTLCNNTYIKQKFENMTTSELLKFITQHICAPNPPHLTQEKFDELIAEGIKNDQREALWRLAFNYNGKNIDFSKIADYFILKRDDYYLVELLSAVLDDLDVDKIIEKGIETRDQNFIINCGLRIKELQVFSPEEIEEIKTRLQSENLL